MAKLILGAITTVVGFVFWLWRRYYSLKAEKKRLLKKIRKLEYEMAKYPVGSDNYNRLRTDWLHFNQQWADIAGCP